MNTRGSKWFIYCRANNKSDHYILYFHSKSMTRFRGIREPVEKALHRTIIARWKEVLDIFQRHPNIDKIGSTASNYGFIWWNYWWARASYLAQVETPIKTTRRHYYEDWLCRIVKNAQETTGQEQENKLSSDLYKFNVSNCWGLSLKDGCTIGNGCTAQEAVYNLLLNQS